MAELLGRWQTAVDSNLNAYPGAKLYTFDSDAKTTPKTTYSDPELAAAHTNPVIANGSGQFPQLFADAGEVFYLVLKTAADVLVDDFEAVSALGETGTSVFLRDFGSGGRLEFSGTDGVVDIAIGPIAGDDVGGDGRIGGWAETQGDSLGVDFAETEFSGDVHIGGNLTVGGTYTTPYARVTDRQTLAGVTSITIPLDPVYESYEIRIQNLLWTTNGDNLTARVSYDGATYKAGAGDYVWEMFHYSSGAAAAASSGGATNLVRLTPASPGTTSYGSEVTIKLFSRAGAYTRLLSSFVHAQGGPVVRIGQGGAIVLNNTYGKATHIQISLAGGAGPISADVIVYGIPTDVS